ncbi:MAG: tRNA (N6-threonylcarbamoyladenosine(37)-N6)-methyltransferase TrmO [Spirochaetaceae bacterium]|nr:tRNA (N6-threonylcarbamoyladenosine(37)-N6)-methyltransferase TrmO [Spirochaetaceae bacterium]
MLQSDDYSKNIKPVAVIHSDFSEKFGIPRQAGLVPELEARVELLHEFSHEEAVRELETFSHIWLILGFSENGESSSLTVRPPRLGGSTRVGVFASRSPFRPNGLGLSAVKLKKIERSSNGTVSLIVSGADMLDGTPVYDIKPYIPISDCVPDALEGYTAETKQHKLKVVYKPEVSDALDALGEKKQALIGILEQDPRQTYFQEPSRIYGLAFAGFNIKFKVTDCILEILDVQKL